MTELSHADKLRANTAARIAREAAAERANFVAEIEASDLAADIKTDVIAALNAVADCYMAVTDMSAIGKALKARGLMFKGETIVRI